MMDFILEMIFSFLIEMPLELAMGSKRIKTGVKTAVFVVLGCSIVSLFAWITYVVSQDGELWRTLAMLALTAGFLIFIIWGAVRGHKKNWKM